MDKSSKSKKITPYWYLLIIVILLCLIGLTWANYRFVEQNLGGSDFLIHWQSTRSHIFRGQSPYSVQTGNDIQQMTTETLIPERLIGHREMLPLYYEFLFAPFALIGDYTFAQALWMSFLEITTLITGLFSIRLAEWRPRLWLVPIFLIFSLTWYHGFTVLVSGNPIVVVSLFIVAAIINIQKKQDVIAGFFLAYATFEPQFVFMLIIFILFWAISHRRWTLFGWIFGWLFFFILIGIFFIPNWILLYIREMFRFPYYNPGLTIGSVFETWLPGIGLQLKAGFTLLLIAIVLIEWWLARGKEFHHFLWTICLTLTISQWIGFYVDPGSVILLGLPLVLLFSIIKERWQSSGDFIVLGILFSLFLGLWILTWDTVGFSLQPNYQPALIIPIPLFCLIGLYWIKWWVIRPTRAISGQAPQAS